MVLNKNQIMAFAFTADNYTFTSINRQCITTFNDNTKIIVKIDVNGYTVFPSQYIDRNGNSILLHNWKDIFNCQSRPLIGGSEYNDFVPDDF